MNVFNKALVIVLLLMSAVFWLVVVAAVLLYPDELVTSAKYTVLFLESNMTLYTQLMFALLGAIVFLASVLILVVELSPGRPSAVQLTQVTSGVAMLTTEAIAQRIKHDMQGLSDVNEVAPKVIARGKFVDIILDLRTGPESNVTGASEEAGRLVRDSVEKNMGVRIGKLVVNIHHEPFKGKRQPQQGKASQATAQSAQPPIYMPGADPAEGKKSPEESKDVQVNCPFDRSPGA